MVVIERYLFQCNIERYNIRQVPLPDNMFEDAEISSWISNELGCANAEQDPEFVAIGSGMYLAYLSKYLVPEGSEENAVARSLVTLNNIRKGPPRIEQGAWEIFGDVMIVNRNSRAWTDLTPLQLSKLEEWLGAGWFSKGDNNEVVSRDGTIHVGSRIICPVDDFYWRSTVQSIFDAILARAINNERILCRTELEGPEGLLYETGCSELCFLEHGSDWDCDDHIMMADDFCENFVEGMRRFALCDPTSELGDGYTKTFQKYINDSVNAYHAAKRSAESKKEGRLV